MDAVKIASTSSVAEKIGALRVTSSSRVYQAIQGTIAGFAPRGDNLSSRPSLLESSWIAAITPPALSLGLAMCFLRPRLTASLPYTSVHATRLNVMTCGNDTAGASPCTTLVRALNGFAIP